MNKIYICSPEGLEEVEVYDITDKFIELYKDNGMLFRDTEFFKINKTELRKVLSKENIFGAYIISDDKEQAIKTWNKYVKKEIKKLNKKLEMYVDFITTE